LNADMYLQYINVSAQWHICCYLIVASDEFLYDHDCSVQHLKIKIVLCVIFFLLSKKSK